MRTTIAVLALIAAARPAVAQSEDQLRAYFEGKTVRLKLDLPGSSEGVDVYPGTAQPIDFPRHAARLKRFGTAYRRGEEVMVTKVKLKSDHIEFQVGGGGYGTFGDDASPHVSVPVTPKSERERNLERDLQKTTDPAQRRTIREELDGLRTRRERENARNAARAAEAEQAKVANIRQRRIEGGSRFNLQYRSAVPDDALTPEGVMLALSEYVDFSPLSPLPTERPDRAGGPADLRKGLSVEEVDAILGRPETITHRKEGTLTVSTSTYRTRDRRVSAEFVEGVLFRFTITSP
ncbi:MAG TPA: hypothetical protein VGQ17_17770 [Gemmatimonadales bacterium]|jgi:hypothetical protein|nr:hypothetical protein [Gemmatimonadales bacterium]